MIRRTNAVKTVVTLFLVAAFFVGAGCTKYASQEDLKDLEAAEAAAISAEKELKALRAEPRKLEGDLKKVEQKLAEMQDELNKKGGNK